MIYDCKGFHGLGGFTKKNTVKETKTGKLLNDLATYLRGFNRSLQNIPAAIFIVLDNDDRDTGEFRQQMEDVAPKNMIQIDNGMRIPPHDEINTPYRKNPRLIKRSNSCAAAIICQHRLDVSFD